jgi:hypothetical protein
MAIAKTPKLMQTEATPEKEKKDREQGRPFFSRLFHCSKEQLLP